MSDFYPKDFMKPIDVPECIKQLSQLLQSSYQSANPMRVKTMELQFCPQFIDGVGYLLPYIKVEMEENKKDD